MRYAIITYFVALFTGLRRITSGSKKQYLACPKTGDLAIDPDSKSPCVECSMSFYKTT